MARQSNTYDFDETGDEFSSEGNDVWSPPEHWSGATAKGVTADEQVRGESLAERNSQLQPENYKDRKNSKGVGRLTSADESGEDGAGEEVLSGEGDLSAEEAAIHEVRGS